MRRRVNLDPTVFPVCTGINRLVTLPSMLLTGVPCTHRDKPALTGHLGIHIVCSLYTQGFFIKKVLASQSSYLMPTQGDFLFCKLIFVIISIMVDSITY